MANRTDYLLQTDGDLDLSRGLRQSPSDGYHAEFLFLHKPGDLRQFPLLGTAAAASVNGATRLTDRLVLQLRADGYINIRIREDQPGRPVIENLQLP